MKRNIFFYLLLLCSISIFAQGVVTPPRTCTVCKKTKPASEFSGDSKTCKACAKKPATRTCSSCKKTKALNAFSGSSKICKACATPKLKNCSVCQQNKPIAEFSRSSNECRECESKRLTIEEDKNDYVDLGLPSGTLWATKNIGANSPNEYGDYFAWGETKGYKSGKTEFSWNTYKWSKGDKDKLTKYCDKSHYGYNGFTDNKIELDLEDDAAYVNWGTNWRMPNSSQIEELVDNCTWEWTTFNGVYGHKVTSKINPNSIFLPANGYHFLNTSCFENEHGYYWSCTLSRLSDFVDDACSLSFRKDKVRSGFEKRNNGCAIRPVRVKP